MQQADHILIPLLNSSFAHAQVAEINGDQALIYLSWHTATTQTKISPFAPDDIEAAVVVDTSTLTGDHWPIIGYDAVPRGIDLSGLDCDLPHESPMDPAIVEALANAIQGLYPWDGFPDADFFTKMLTQQTKLPTLARMTADFPKPPSSEAAND